MTSQIFANIYFNEFDRFIKHYLKPQVYLRYGDDFIIIAADKDKINYYRQQAIKFLQYKLQLEINNRNDIITKTKYGAQFLGVDIFSKGRRLNERNWQRMQEKINFINIASYSGLVKQHSNCKKIKLLNWFLLDK